MKPISPKSFIKNFDILKEDHRVSDLFDMGHIATDFQSKLLNAPHKSMLGLVGEYGTGKSTLLHNISQNIEKDYWIEFDAWKYPERKELWEGFVLDFARQIDEKAFEDIRQAIDGKQNDDKKALVNTVSSIPGLAVIKNLTHFLETSPARRTYEIQAIFTEFIRDKASGKNVYVIVEDIDRSGDAGMFFLETLKYFLQNLDVPNIIKVIVPIAESKFQENIDSYIKCLDVVDFYNLSNVKMAKFVEEVFDVDLIANLLVKKQITQFLEQLMSQPVMSPRKLKLILRKASLNYMNQQVDGLEPDFRMSIMFEAAKYIYVNQDITLFRHFKEGKTISNNVIFSSLAFGIAANTALLDATDTFNKPPQDFKLIRRTGTVQQHPSTPYLVNNHFGNDHYSFCCDFYLNY